MVWKPCDLLHRYAITTLHFFNIHEKHFSQFMMKKEQNWNQIVWPAKNLSHFQFQNSVAAKIGSFGLPYCNIFMYSWALHYKTPLRNSRPTFQVYAVRRYAALLVTRRDATELRFVMRFVNRMHMASSL